MSKLIYHNACPSICIAECQINKNLLQLINNYCFSIMVYKVTLDEFEIRITNANTKYFKIKVYHNLFILMALEELPLLIIVIRLNSHLYYKKDI